LPGAHRFARRSPSRGVYLWESREAAERMYSAEWRTMIADRYGTAPQILFRDARHRRQRRAGLGGSRRVARPDRFGMTPENRRFVRTALAILGLMALSTTVVWVAVFMFVRPAKGETIDLSMVRVADSAYKGFNAWRLGEWTR
jgi:hypothetical protein